MGMTSRPKELSELQQDCTAFPSQGNPSSCVHSTLPTILPLARQTMSASLYSMVQGAAVILLPARRALSGAARVLLRVAPQGLPTQTRTLADWKVCCFSTSLGSRPGTPLWNPAVLTHCPGTGNKRRPHPFSPFPWPLSSRLSSHSKLRCSRRLHRAQLVPIHCVPKVRDLQGHTGRESQGGGEGLKGSLHHSGCTGC